MLKLLKHHLSPLLYSYIDGVKGVSYNGNKATVGMKLYIDSRNDDNRLRPTSSDGLFDKELFCFAIIAQKSELLPLYYEIMGDERFNFTLQLDRDYNEWWLEIMPKSAPKPNSAKILKKYLRA